MDLTNEEKRIILELLLQIAVPLKDAPIVLAIIEKLRNQIENNNKK